MKVDSAIQQADVLIVKEQEELIEIEQLFYKIGHFATQNDKN